MPKLKIDIIKDAYSQLRISGLTVEPSPDDIATALCRLENMMRELSIRIDIGYNFEDVPNLNSEVGVRSVAYHMLATNLAIRLTPDFDQAVPTTLHDQASQSLSAITGLVVKDRLKKMTYPNGHPIGSGNRYRNRYIKFFRGGH